MGELAALIGNAEPYAWPGGYPIGYVVDDGAYLCARCVNDPSNPVHVGGEPDGWRLEGYDVLEGDAGDYDGAVSCEHCHAVLVEGFGEWFEVYSLTFGALDRSERFTDAAAAEAFAAELAAELAAIDEWAVYLMPHYCGEGDCDCAQWLTDHRPLYSSEGES